MQEMLVKNPASPKTIYIIFKTSFLHKEKKPFLENVERFFFKPSRKLRPGIKRIDSGEMEGRDIQ
jgi:hypothetical protein